ncbi:hypothetical protein D3C86_1163210 [compost metagenome]
MARFILTALAGAVPLTGCPSPCGDIGAGSDSSLASQSLKRSTLDVPFVGSISQS